MILVCKFWNLINLSLSCQLIDLHEHALNSTASLIVVTGVLAPFLEETVFRGFFMTSLTKWYLLCIPCPLPSLSEGFKL
jgi:membrane protease YdiL (CAAX protease family)